MQDVQVDGTSVVNNGVASIPFASSTQKGIVGIDTGYGIGIIGTSHNLVINKPTDAQIKEGVNNYRPIVPANQHASAFYGMAKAAGDTTQATSDNAVGNYTDAAKIAIQKMLGVSNKFELLQAVTTEEDLTEINIDISTTPSVKLFGLIETPANGQSGQVIRAGMTLIDNTILTLMYFPGIDRTSQKTFASFIADSTSGRHFADQATSNYAISNGSNVYRRTDMFGYVENSVYNSIIKVYGSTFPAGTIVKIYGVRV